MRYSSLWSCFTNIDWLALSKAGHRMNSVGTCSLFTADPHTMVAKPYHSITLASYSLHFHNYKDLAIMVLLKIYCMKNHAFS